MLIYSMSPSVDGFINDREGEFAWGAPGDELFGFHLARVRELGGYLLGRRLYEAMLVWETDPSMRDSGLRTAFADVWCAIAAASRRLGASSLLRMWETWTLAVFTLMTSASAISRLV